MTDWNFYSKRRNIDLVNLIIINNIESYEQLVDLLKEKNVTAPEKGLFQSAYAIAVPPIPTTRKSSPKSTAKNPKQKSPAKKKTRKKKTSG